MNFAFQGVITPRPYLSSVKVHRVPSPKFTLGSGVVQLKPEVSEHTLTFSEVVSGRGREGDNLTQI